jgi:hypothetical protein
VEGLRQELRAAEAHIDEMKAQHAAWVSRVCDVCVCVYMFMYFYIYVGLGWEDR